MTARVPAVTLVLGGARSGKSLHAEHLVGCLPSPWIYVATAQAFDDEMRARIALHRARRDARWATVDAPLHLAPALDTPHPVLIDCLTLWLSNLMLGEHDIDTAVSALERALDARAAPTVMVSSEVGLGIVPETPLGRRFRDAAGMLHQRLAANAGHVVLMVAGIPMRVK